MRNLQINRLDRVEVVPCALAEQEKVVRFFGPDAADPRSGDGRVVSTAEEGGPLLSIEARTLNSIAMERGLKRLDLIKIDVEGYEWPVLQGAVQTIAKLRPHIIFEHDAAYVQRGGGSVATIASFLRRHRYRLFAIGRKKTEPLNNTLWPDGGNLWAAPVEGQGTVVGRP